MPIRLYFLFFLLCQSQIFAQTGDTFQGETITFKSDDGLTITADLYLEHETKAPFIILYHQAGYSRVNTPNITVSGTAEENTEALHRNLMLWVLTVWQLISVQGIR